MEGPPTPAQSGELRHRASEGSYENGVVWTERDGCNADVYVLARNDVFGEQADHRDQAQWRFYVVLEGALPAKQKIGIAALRVAPVSFEHLAQEVSRVFASRTALCAR